MKAVFNCDDVFDVLTREPFPSGGVDDGVVESHLAVCHECRQLAEAFRPAIGLFHESLSAGFDDELPMYRGRLKPVIDSLPQSSPFAPRKDVCSLRGYEKIGTGTSQPLESLGKLARPLGASPIFSQPRSEQRHSLLCRSLAIAASLIMVGAAIFAALAANQRASGIAPVAANIRIHENRDDTLLAALEIPTVCRSVTTALKLAAAADIACCTKCHSSGSRVASTEKAIVKSAAACVACHDGRLDEAFSAIEYDRMRTRFRKSFDVIKVTLATDGSTAHLHARPFSRHPNSFDELLAVVLDACFRASLSADAATPPGLWARRADSQPLNPRFVSATACDSECLC